jgi:hypothetical protein
VKVQRLVAIGEQLDDLPSLFKTPPLPLKANKPSFSLPMLPMFFG